MNRQSLPKVLSHRRGSISMERALTQIKDILEEYNAVSSAGGDEAAADRSQASIDDVETMLDALSGSDMVEITCLMYPAGSGKERIGLDQICQWLDAHPGAMITAIRPLF